MALAIKSVKNHSSAMVSAGNTGALMAFSKLFLKTISGINRPAIAACFPTKRGEVCMLDLGANIECDKNNLIQFALMGQAFAKIVIGIKNPRVGLLNVGEEEIKGFSYIQDASESLKKLSKIINYCGFIEGDRITDGLVDVIVTDGFTGNIALKTAEGTAGFFTNSLKEALKKSIFSKIRNNFIAGVVVLIPIGITLYLTLFFVRITGNIVPKEINPNNYLPFNIPGLEILVALTLITLIGWLSLSFLGKRILKLIDDLFKRIPFLRTVYSAIVQMTETFSKKDDGKKSVVLIEYPRKGVWAVGFATKENKGEMAEKTGKNLINVFVPTTPNPTSGFLLMFPVEDVIYLNMSFEEASKFIVSAGTSTKKS